MTTGNMHERSQPRPSRPANEPVTFWEDVKAGFWVWLVVIAVAIAALSTMRLGARWTFNHQWVGG
jgi:hypothetical protein